MLFWSNNSTAPNDDSPSDARAFARRSVRSFEKSIRCSQSTAIVAPREAMFMVGPLLVSVGVRRVVFVCGKHFSTFQGNSPEPLHAEEALIIQGKPLDSNHQTCDRRLTEDLAD